MRATYRWADHSDLNSPLLIPLLLRSASMQAFLLKVYRLLRPRSISLYSLPNPVPLEEAGATTAFLRSRSNLNLIPKVATILARTWEASRQRGVSEHRSPEPSWK